MAVNKTKSILFPIISGILLAISFPMPGLKLMVWFALIPLLYIIDKGTRREAVRGGLIAGFIFFTLLLYWVTNSMTNYGGLPTIVGILILFILAAYLSIYFGLFGWCLTLFPKEKGYIKWFIAPFIWVALELIRSSILTGFPWGLIGYSQFDNIMLIQIADITGVYGVSFLIIIVNISLYLHISNLRDKVKNRKLVFTYLLTTTILIGGSALYGRKKIKAYYSTEEGTSLKVALIQGNIDQDIKWNPAYKNYIINTYKGMTEKAISENPDLVVWPESSLPFYLQEESEERENLLAFVDDSGLNLLVGADAYRIINMQIESYNRAYLLTPSKREVYDKIHLVPYGEYVPLKRLFPFIDKLVEGIGEYSEGDEYKVFNLPKGRFATLICYEIIFPNLTRRFVNSGAQFLVNITNDAWFGISSAPYQHIAMAPFRAVENRIPIVRGANTGISAFINPIGKFVKYSGIFVGETLIGNIRLNNNIGNTIYSRYGDIFAYLSLLIAIGTLSYIKFSHKEEITG